MLSGSTFSVVVELETELYPNIVRLNVGVAPAVLFVSLMQLVS